MRILNLISKKRVFSFEEAIYYNSLLYFCNKKNYELGIFNIFDYVQKFGTEATFIYLYKEINEKKYDVIILPVTNDEDVNLILDPLKIGQAHVYYFLTGDHAIVGNLYSYLPKEKSTIVVFNHYQKEMVKDKNYLEMPPLLYEEVFFRDQELLEIVEDKEEQKHLIDVSFFGRKTDSRLQYLTLLAENNIKVWAFGNGWSDGVLNFEQGKIKTALRKNLSFQREILTRSKISVVFDDYIKNIHFEIPACNALPVVFKSENVLKYFRPCKLPMFTTKEEFLNVINKFLKDNESRNRVRDEIRNLVSENYTTESFYNKLFENYVKE